MNSKYKTLEILQYVSLLFGLGVTAFIFGQTYDTFNRFLIIVAGALLYVFWGYWHHGHMEKLDKLVIFEYSLVAFIVILLSALGLGIIRFI